MVAKYGKLIILEEAGRSPQGRILYRCRCECGAERIASGTSLRTGNVTQCSRCKAKAQAETLAKRTLAKFEDRLKTEAKTGCWEGTARNSQGRTVLSINGKSVYAHRLAYELTHGPIPKGFLVCHHCDNPACFRPDHLFLGTQADNMQDMQKKNRQRYVGRKTQQLKGPDGRFIRS